jgi:hypothetical protein
MGVFSFQWVEIDGMTETKTGTGEASRKEWVEAAINELRKISPEEQEALYALFLKTHPEAGEQLAAAKGRLGLEAELGKRAKEIEKEIEAGTGKPKEEPKPVEPVEEEPKKAAVGKMVGGFKGRFLRILQGEKRRGAEPNGTVVALRVVEQRKPEPEEEEKKALPAVAPVAGWDQAVAAMNRQHAIIENVGGKAVISSWEPSTIDPGRLVVVFQNKESFLLRYSNRFVSIDVHDGKGGTVRVPLAQWWLGHRDREQYRGVTFLPGGEKTVGELLNLWQGWGVEAKSGDWGLIRNHIRMVIAGGNKEFGDYVERWIAWAIQNPAAQAEVALVLIGLKGAGKGTLVRCLQRIFGAHAFQVTSREEVIGKFNGHLQDCVLFVADEAYWGGDKRCVGRLQGMITEPTLPIERKGIDLIQVPNFLHVVMLSEPGWVIPAGRYGRRYAALGVSGVRRGDRDYFRALHREIAEGGAEAMFYELGRMDLGDWHPRDIPQALLSNQALQKQQGFTLPPLEQWYRAGLGNLNRAISGVSA